MFGEVEDPHVGQAGPWPADLADSELYSADFFVPSPDAVCSNRCDSVRRGGLCGEGANILKTYETELDDRSFIKRLSAVDPEEIIRRGKMDFSTNKAALRFARVILEKYNSQQRGGRKLPYRFKG